VTLTEKASIVMEKVGPPLGEAGEGGKVFPYLDYCWFSAIM